MSSQRDYVATAHRIAALRPLSIDGDVESLDGSFDEGYEACRRAIAQSFADQYAADNARFKRDVFFRACNVPV